MKSGLTLAELIELLGISRQAIDKHVDAGIIIRLGRDRYDVQSVPRYIAFVRGGGDQNTDRQRLAAAKAKKAELEVAALENRLVPADQVEKVWVSLITAMRSRLLSIPTKIAQRLGMCQTDAERHALVLAALHEAMIELSQMEIVIEGDADESDDDDDDEDDEPDQPASTV